MIKKESRNPWLWVPSLYVAEGLPYVMVMMVSGIMYKRLDISNTELALYTSWLYLPWVIKPLWSPVVDLLKTKRFWILLMQFFIGVGLAGVALTVPADNFFRYTLAFFWLMAFSSATQDIAADGYYMISLDDHQQAWFVGVRTLAYRIAFISGQGLLVILAGHLEETTGDIPFAWMITFLILAALFLFFVLYHLIILPHPKKDEERKEKDYKAFLTDYYKTFAIFFKRDKILIIIAFILLYRLGEGQLAKLASPFLLDAYEKGGLALTTSQVGLVYGTVGWIALSLGGILGGFAVAKQGLKFWIWWMLIAINLPDAVYIFLAYTQTSNLLLINTCIAIEQFGYGFGFAAFLLYIIYISEGKFKTTHYAIATAFMALGNMLPGMISGWLQESVGYKQFFILVLISTIPSFIVTKFIPLDSDFGKKKNQRMNSLRLKYILLTITAVLLFGLNVSCQSNKHHQSESDFTQVDEIIQSAIKDSAFPGSVVLVSKDSKIIYEKAFGHLTYDDTSAAVNINTIYDIASLTKVIATTTAVMICYDKNLFSLNDPVAKYIPEFAQNGKENVTIKNLLLHNSGLPAFKRFYKNYSSADEVINDIYKTPLSYEPGSETVYSDLGFITLTKVVEQVTGKRFDVYCNEEIFNPLQMNSTCFNPPDSLQYKIAPTEYDNYWRNKLVWGKVHDETASLLNGVAGHAGLFSIAEDISNLLQLLLNDGTFNGHQIIKSATVKLFTARYSDKSTRALGWDTKSGEKSSAGKLFDITSFGHLGFTGTSVWIDPTRELFVVFLTNRIYPTRENKKIYKVRPFLYDAIINALD